MAKRLEKLDVGGKQSWYFVNEQQGTIRYRELLFPFPELNCFDQGDGTDFEILEVLEGPQIKTLGEQVHVDPSSIKKEELHQWIRIVAQHESPSGQKTIVPTTSIRKLYEFMRDDFEDRDFRRGLLNVFAESPKALVKLCKESFKQFASYENLSEGWGSSSRKRLPDAPDRLSESSGTNEVVSFFTRQGESCLSDAGFSYVAREFNPRRTTNGVFENGLSAKSSGGGGIDVFLKKEGNPVVGEIKVRDDADPFYALIQCLTYAIELGTASQFKRLQSKPIGRLREFDDLDVQSAVVDICIICIEHSHLDMYGTLSRLSGVLQDSDQLPFLGRIYLTFNDGNELRYFTD